MRRQDIIPVEIYEPTRKIIKEWPVEVRRELGAVLVRLQSGEMVGMPDVRSMASVAKGVFEIRIRSRADAHRVFYVSVTARGILVFHAFIKKSQQTPQKEIEIARARLQSFLRNI